jgi:ligand-binding sensor domain-containing protein/signal transduction histidine kinase
MRSRFLISTFLTLGGLLRAATPTLAPGDYAREMWRSEDGLPQNKIQALTQTPDGFLWIGTSGGLVKFDGVRFTVFDRSNAPALRDDSITTLRPGHDGSLWIGTEGGGLVHWRAGSWVSYGRDQGLTNGFVRSIVEDSHGRVWVGTDRGLFRLEGNELLRLDASRSLPISATRKIFEDRSGQIWLATSFGIYQMRNNVPVRLPEFEVMGNNVVSIAEDGQGTLWFAGDEGVYRVIGGRIQRDDWLERISADRVLVDRSGDIWIGTPGEGLWRLHGGQRFFYRAPAILPDNTVSSIFEDRERELWIGTQDGLLRLTQSSVTTINSRNGLEDDNVATVSAGPDQAIWMATVTGQVYRYADGKATRFALPRAVSGARVRSIYFDHNGTLWIGTAGQGVFRIEKGAVRNFSMANGMRSNGVRQLLEDQNGAMWVATGSGLTRWDGVTLHTYYLEDGLSYGGVRSLAIDGKGDLLVGTDGGLDRVRNGKFVHDAAFAQLGFERIWAILPEADGTLWLGTRGNGLVRIRNGKITRYTTRNGLLSNSIYQILDDGHERLWMSTPAGIFSTDRRELDAVAEGRTGPIAIVPYGTDEGMESSQMNGGVQSAGCRTESGEIWFPSVKGAVRIDPKQLHLTPAAPVLIESLSVGDQPIPITPGMSIPPGQGKLEIAYTSPTLRSPDRITFKYKLENFDKDWMAAPKRRVAAYTNLSPGKYTFRVVARDGAAPDRVSEASLPFTWEPLFYQTRWFMFVCIAAAATLVLAGLRLFAAQTKQRYALVLAERTRVAREMHDTVIQGCVGVSTLLEAASTLPAAAADKARELHDRARLQIRSTINEAREAVWDLRHESFARSMAETLRDFARQISAAEGIPVRTDVTGTPPPLDNDAGRNLLLVAREAIRNAVSHGEPREIAVKLAFEPSEVRLEVCDDGRGFAPEAARENGHYGIVGMRERVEQLGGMFNVRSSPGHGTTVIACLPVNGKGKHG